MKDRLIVIGGTAAGLSAASKAKRLKPDLEVIVYEKSGHVSYGSCGLPYFLGDTIKESDDLISLTPEELKNKRDISTYIHHEVVEIDRKSKKVKVLDIKNQVYHEQSYDYLVIATGALPIAPPIPGIDSDGVYFLRTVEDGISIKNGLNGKSKAVVIGGGFIGLEVAEQLVFSNIQVDLFEALPRLLPFLNEEYSEKVKETLEKNKVCLHLNTMVVEILNEDGRVTGVKTSNGDIINADMVIISTGVKPNSKLASDCGLETGLKGGIVVDETMQTSDSSIWACGDCVVTKNIITGQAVYIPLGTTANKQGKVAGSNIGGEKEVFTGVLGSQVTKVFDLYIASTGLTKAQAIDSGFAAVSNSIIKSDKASYYPGGIDNYITLIFDENTGRLLGAQGIGGISIAGRINVLATAITGKMTIDEINRLDLVYTPSVAPVYDPILIAASQALKKVKK